MRAGFSQSGSGTTKVIEEFNAKSQRRWTMMDLPCVGVGRPTSHSILVAIATSGRQRIKLYKPSDEADRIDDWLYLRETLYAFMFILIVSTGAGPYSLDALILGLMNKHVT